MKDYSMSEAFSLMPKLLEKIDEKFHHGSCDGNMFVGPADDSLFRDFWKTNNSEVRRHVSVERNKSILAAYSCQRYGIYFYYIDDNDFSASLHKYNSDTNKWDIISCWGGLD